MRRIMTAQEQEARRQRNGRVLAVLMLLILLGSTAGYAFLYYDENNQGTTGAEENGVQQTAAGWSFKAGEQTITVQHSPSETANSTVLTTKTASDYAGTTLYIDAENQAIYAEIALAFNTYASRVQPACYGDCERNVPEVNCSQALIVWTDSSEDTVSEQEQCVFIKGDMRTVDAFIYRAFGIQ
ncbi:MAG TPA: hypothetical protein VJK03_01495 [Candidatus Nanoarchaeia archaeon]|nr:hypothetical protein [Candidatus Nanoarchaeia archaeon]